MPMLGNCIRRAVLLCLPLFAFCQPPPKAKPARSVPTEVDRNLALFGRELLDQWACAPRYVNPQPIRTRAFPGQRLIVGLTARGDGREASLKDLVLDLRLEWPQGRREYPALNPVMVRSIKAEGADFACYALSAAGVSAPQELEAKLSVVSLALFDLDWQVPGLEKSGELRFSGTFRINGKATPIKAEDLSLVPFDQAEQEGAFKDAIAHGEWTMGYYRNPEPPRLLNSLRLAAVEKSAFAPNILTFYIQALKASPECAAWLMSRLDRESRETRLYGLLVLKEAGLDTSLVLARLPEGDRDLLFRVSPGSAGALLPDPYLLDIRSEAPVQIGGQLDMLWSTFIATGQFRPVRTIANALQWRDDWKVFLKVKENFQKTGKGPERMTPELMRASGYGAAGWSLGSFYRNHGLATDYIEAMKADPMIPEVIREELRNLIGNPAFDFKKEP